MRYSPGTLALALALTACSTSVVHDTDACKLWIRDCGDETVERWAASAQAMWSRSTGVDGTPFAEIIDAAFLGDSLILVGDHRAARIHYFDMDGGPVRVHGRIGAGPGELGSLDGVGPAGAGAVWGYDVSRRRLVVFSSAGEITTETLRIAARGAWPNVIGFLDDSTALVMERHLPVPLDQPHGSRSRDSTRLLLLVLPTMAVEAVADVPREDVVVGAGGARAGIGFIPFGPVLHVAVDPVRGVAYWGFSESLLVERWGPGEGRKKFLALETRRRPIEPGLMRAGLARLSTPLAEALRGSEPTEMPAFGRLLVDGDGFLWVSEYQDDSALPSHWAVFDLAGRLVRFVELPARFTLKAARHPNVVGVYEESSGEESARLYQLRRQVTAR